MTTNAPAKLEANKASNMMANMPPGLRTPTSSAKTPAAQVEEAAANVTAALSGTNVKAFQPVVEEHTTSANAAVHAPASANATGRIGPASVATTGLTLYTATT